eukprot:NODE_1050_length_1082_cov_21.363988_g733_i0.p1 GENE.NODE_1050_length_1082_cov_21.363988_g733_i0~~NODE_1050_length_1082_cov_21.363988_g733_i0.p1  ORF type:complete len:310 (+),score=109.79 NODE_1050_length_1082_cov_21.363988_g733_i0:65-994(+)
MTKISKLLSEKDPKAVTVSFEYFPPKTDTGVTNLIKRIGLMMKAKPEFCDVTWGAGGGTSELTFSICKQAMEEHGALMNMHLTCTNMPREKVDGALEACKGAGIVNIVALRGDPPQGESEWKSIDTGFSCALDLVEYIRKLHGDLFCLSVGGYPEGHPNVIGPDGVCPPDAAKAEIEYLKKKVDAGSDVIITQLFYDVDIFLNWHKICRAAGINIPILPGLLPIVSYGGFERMTAMCKTAVPESLRKRLEAVKDDDAAVKQLGIDVCVEMCQKLIENGHTHLHFYCLNNEASTFAVMKKLGLPTPDADA